MQNEWTDSQRTRRSFLSKSSLGLGSLAVANLFQREAAAAKSTADHHSCPHFRPTARRVIYIHTSGGPSQLDTFDPKPQLQEWDGQELPASIRGTQRITTMTRFQNKIAVAASGHHFARYGESGAEMNVLFRHLSTVADELCLLRAVHTEPINHDPAVTFLQTGSPLAGRPAIGSWLSYGLGSGNRDLPEFVVLLSNPGGQPVPPRYWHNGFLPSRHQGVQLQSQGDPVLFLSNPAGMSHENRGRIVERIAALNKLKHADVGDPEIEARIDAFELAYRMQISVPELLDVSRESQATLDLYGVEPGKPSFAANCLLARRLAESGVRFIQLYDRGWDHHGDVTSNIRNKIQQTDRASGALIHDLRQRGMLEETLVVWGGEFGRTTYAQGGKGKTFGRDHHPRCFSLWLAGGGIRPGITYGETDDFSYNVVKQGVHVHDLQATMLHCLGIDHERLTYRFKGRDFRLTDISGRVVHEILA